MERPKTKGLALLILLSCGSPLLQAEELTPTAYGAEVVLAAPLLSLRDLTGKTGRGLALFAEQPLSDSAIIQTRIGFINYPLVTKPTNPQTPHTYPFIPDNSYSLSANATSLAIDVRQYLPLSLVKHIFVLAGLTATRYEFRANYDGSTTDANGVTVAEPMSEKVKTSTKCGFEVGAGYDFHGVILTVRYAHLPMDGHSLAALETGLSVRF